MHRMLLLIAALVFAAGVPATAYTAGQTLPPHLVAAVDAPARPDADTARDPARKPAEVLAFAGVQQGWKVGEYMPGAGYFTRILARAVGPAGRVMAYQPAEIVRLRPSYLTEIQAVAAEPGLENVRVVSAPTGEFGAAEPLDLVFTAQNFHDLHGRFAPPGTADSWLMAAHSALKPGGILLVIDHEAQSGAGLTGAAALHRIDREAVKAQITAAGFILDQESELLRNTDDPRTASVFDPSIQGRTDQFILRFRKPD